MDPPGELASGLRSGRKPAAPDTGRRGGPRQASRVSLAVPRRPLPRQHSTKPKSHAAEGAPAVTLRSEDIKAQQFRVVVRGYKVEEVDAFLEAVRRELT